MDIYAQNTPHPKCRLVFIDAGRHSFCLRLHEQWANVAKLAEQTPIHWVLVAQIGHSLQGRSPIAVGFDIDDTVLFSSPSFWRGKKTSSPDSEEYLKNPTFWEKMTNSYDVRTETVSKTLQDNFVIPAANMNPVIFAGDKLGQNSKTQLLKSKQNHVFYGDSDNDMTAAHEVGARAIRILRVSNSTYRPLPQAGALGEEVIVNSEY